MTGLWIAGGVIVGLVIFLVSAWALEEAALAREKATLARERERRAARAARS